MADNKPITDLESCVETVHQLQEENEQLRNAAGAFGQLAERLNQTLHEERRLGDERRRVARPVQDRRDPARRDESAPAAER